MALSEVIVCSFFTDDAYYRAAATRLASDLDALGVAHVIELLEVAPGEEWPDVCRKKIPFIARVCTDNPHAKVVWTDVDCEIRELPEAIINFSADFIGFQRSFANPLNIGYASRTRFWEPCFFGINSTPAGRALITEAARMEATLPLRATDDWFLEEAWRALAAELSFQVIPSRFVDREGANDPEAFFVFGSSGQVPSFKNKVEQHSPIRPPKRNLRRGLRRRARVLAKRLEATLPAGASRKLRTLSDRVGATEKLVSTEASANPERQSLIDIALRSAQKGDKEHAERTIATLKAASRISVAERASIAAAESFLHYASDRTGSGEPLSLTWWARPFPGNFGDWLSPLVVRHLTDRPIHFQAPAARAPQRHLVAVGSIGRFIKPNSVVVGTGVASPDTELATKATFISLRGPLTAAELVGQGGPRVDTFGDPGLLLSRVIPVTRGETNGRIAFVRHTNHRLAPVRLPEGVDELSVLMSHPNDISHFVTALNQYDAVVTSAMHVMIACHSYGIPCALVTFEGLEEAVPGSGMKYEDYCLGAGVEVQLPIPVPVDLTQVRLLDHVQAVAAPPTTLDDLEAALRTGIDELAPVGQR